MKTIAISETVELRPAAEHFAPDLSDLVTENFDHLHNWLPWVTPKYSLTTAEKFLREKVRENDNRTEQIYLILIDGHLSGVIGLSRLDMVNKSGEIAYWLAENRQGAGVITNSVEALLEVSFNELNLNRIVIRCATENFKSQGIPNRLGFTKEGVSRQVEWLHDRFVGLVVFSLLKEEWDKGASDRSDKESRPQSNEI